MFIDRRRSRSRSWVSACRLQDATPATPFLCPLRLSGLIGFIDTGNVATYPAKEKQEFSHQGAELEVAGCCGEKAMCMQGVWSVEHSGIPDAFLSCLCGPCSCRDIVGSGAQRYVVGRKMRSIGGCDAVWVVDDDAPGHMAVP